MCATCGCSETDGVVVIDPETGVRTEIHTQGHGADHGHSHGPGDDHDHIHDHEHGHAHAHNHVHNHPHVHDHEHAHGHDEPHTDAHPHRHEHDHAHGGTGVPAASASIHGRTVALEQDILAKNRLLAERNRGWFAGREILALNLMSSPGAGKTTLLERTIRDLRGEAAISVVEGDQATLNDAERIRATGCKVIQINTGTGCHLDADMLARGLEALKPPFGSLVMIENVGNLVRPALFDLGERAKVVIVSVTEGEDKPVKYPHMFQAADVILMNKIDLLPHVRFNVQRCIDHVRQVNPKARVFQLSATTGEGMDAWYGWLKAQLPATAGATQ